MARFTTTAAAFVAVLVVAFGLAQVVTTPGAPAGVASAQPLVAFDGCDDVAAWYRDQALERVTAYGLGDAGPVVSPGLPLAGDVAVLRQDASAESAVAADSAPAPAPVAGAGGGAAFSATNVQVAGVDEPDVVKTDGRHLYAIAQGRLQVVDVSADAPRRVADVALPQGWSHELVLDDDRLLVTTTGDGAVHPLPADARIAVDAIGPAPGAPHSTLTLLDVSDPATPRTVSTLELEGQYVSARATDGVVRVVLRSQPSLPFLAPSAPGPQAEAAALEHNRRVVREATVEDWLPGYTLAVGDAAPVQGGLVACTQVHHPAEHAGLGTLSVLSLDLHGDLSPEGTTAISADGETVSASPDRLYVALTRWPGSPFPQDAPAEGVRTAIHAFDTTDPRSARYVASGEVQGQLLSQFALDEHEGYLRVATTEQEIVRPVAEPMPVEPDGGIGDGAGPPDDATSSIVAPEPMPRPVGTTNSVRILAEQGDALVEVGAVTGLGKPGERIRGVRFLGDLGYVVTFLQTDPLYVLDLSEPTVPQALGELEIPGYSAYLHPLGEGRLLGVGQDADATGRTQGLQLSLFDVADPSNPRRLATAGIPDAFTPVEHDHRAFLWWAPASLAALPVEVWPRAPEPIAPAPTGREAPHQPFTGVAGFHVDGASISEVGRVAMPPGPEGYAPPPARVLVVGDRLLAVSDVGVQSAALTSLDPGHFVAFTG